MHHHTDLAPVVIVTAALQPVTTSTGAAKRTGGGAPPPRLALNSLTSLASSESGTPDSARDSAQGGVSLHGSMRLHGQTSMKDRSLTPQSTAPTRTHVAQLSRDEQQFAKNGSEGDGVSAPPNSRNAHQVTKQHTDTSRVLSTSPSRNPAVKASSKSPTRYSCPAPSTSVSSRSPREMRVSPSSSTISPSSWQSSITQRPQGPSATLAPRQQGFGTSPKVDSRQSPPVVGTRGLLSSGPPAVTSTPAWATRSSGYGSRQTPMPTLQSQVHPQLAASIAQNGRLPNSRATFPTMTTGCQSNDVTAGRVGALGKLPCSPASLRSYRDLHDPLIASGKTSSSTVIPNGSRLTGPVASDRKEDRAVVLQELLTSVEAIDRQLGTGRLGTELDASNLNDLAAMAAAAAKAVATVAAVAANSAINNGGLYSNPNVPPEVSPLLGQRLPGSALEEISEVPDSVGEMLSPTVTTPRQLLSSRQSNRVGGSLNANLCSSSSAFHPHLRNTGQSGGSGAFSSFNKVGSAAALDLINQIQTACDEALRRTEADDELAGLRAARDEVCGLREEAIEWQRLQKQREAKLVAGLEEALAAKGDAERQLAEAQQRLAAFERRAPAEDQQVAEARQWASKFEEADRERRVFKQRWQEAQHELQRTDRDLQAPAVVHSPPLPPAVSSSTVVTNRRSLPARGRQGGLGQGPPVGAHRKALS